MGFFNYAQPNFGGNFGWNSITPNIVPFSTPHAFDPNYFYQQSFTGSLANMTVGPTTSPYVNSALSIANNIAANLSASNAQIFGPDTSMYGNCGPQFSSPFQTSCSVPVSCCGTGNNPFGPYAQQYNQQFQQPNYQMISQLMSNTREQLSQIAQRLGVNLNGQTGANGVSPEVQQIIEQKEQQMQQVLERVQSKQEQVLKQNQEMAEKLKQMSDLAKQYRDQLIRHDIRPDDSADDTSDGAETQQTRTAEDIDQDYINVIAFWKDLINEVNNQKVTMTQYREAIRVFNNDNETSLSNLRTRYRDVADLSPVKMYNNGWQYSSDQDTFLNTIGYTNSDERENIKAYFVYPDAVKHPDCTLADVLKTLQKEYPEKYNEIVDKINTYNSDPNTTTPVDSASARIYAADLDALISESDATIVSEIADTLDEWNELLIVLHYVSSKGSRYFDGSGRTLRGRDVLKAMADMKDDYVTLSQVSERDINTMLDNIAEKLGKDHLDAGDVKKLTNIFAIDLDKYQKD